MCKRDFLLKEKEKVAFKISEGKCTKPHVLSSKIGFCVCDSDHHSQKNLTCSLLAELSESTSLSFLSVCVVVFYSLAHDFIFSVTGKHINRNAIVVFISQVGTLKI